MLQKIINEGEGYLIEFKEFPAHLDRNFCAFANASGGTIYIGISDNGRIKPVSLTNRIKSTLQTIARNCDPPVQISWKVRDPAGTYATGWRSNSR